jgi:hypothetical protein
LKNYFHPIPNKNQSVAQQVLNPGKTLIKAAEHDKIRKDY